MNASFTVKDAEIKRATDAAMDTCLGFKDKVENTMATTYWLRVQNNLGDTGIDRPFHWAPLSPAYARRVNRPHATLLLTGALAAAIKVEQGPDGPRVHVSNSDVPYALAHQFGNPDNNLPARPYFPMDESGKQTDATKAAVMEAAQQELRRLLS